MFTNTLKHRIIFTVIFEILFFLFGFLLFKNIYTSSKIIIPYITPEFNICEKLPFLWEKIKLIYLIFYVLVSFIYSHFIYKIFANKKISNSEISSYNKKPESDIYLYIGETENKLPIYLQKESLYQNILITGTIGTGKTSSAMYPFTKQLIRYQCQTSDLKMGMLILDVKGNYHEKVLEYAKKYGRLNDVIIIELNRKI